MWKLLAYYPPSVEVFSAVNKLDDFNSEQRRRMHKSVEAIMWFVMDANRPPRSLITKDLVS